MSLRVCTWYVPRFWSAAGVVALVQEQLIERDAAQTQQQTETDDSKSHSAPNCRSAAVSGCLAAADLRSAGSLRGCSGPRNTGYSGCSAPLKPGTSGRGCTRLTPNRVDNGLGVLSQCRVDLSRNGRDECGLFGVVEQPEERDLHTRSPDSPRPVPGNRPNVSRVPGT